MYYILLFVATVKSPSDKFNELAKRKTFNVNYKFHNILWKLQIRMKLMHIFHG